MSTSISPLGQTTNSGAQIISLPPGTTNAAPYVLSVSQSGCIIKVPVIAQAATITLPAAATSAGFTCRAIVAGAAAVGFIVRLDAGAGLLNSWKMNNATPTSNAAQQYIQFTATAVTGDYIEIICDGFSYSARACSTAAAGVSSA